MYDLMLVGLLFGLVLYFVLYLMLDLDSEDSLIIVAVLIAIEASFGLLPIWFIIITFMIVAFMVLRRLQES